jgi:hypothetical protein
MAIRLRKYHLVIQLVYLLREIIQLEESHLEQDTIALIQDQKLWQDIGLVINGELEQK